MHTHIHTYIYIYIYILPQWSVDWQFSRTAIHRYFVVWRTEAISFSTNILKLFILSSYVTEFSTRVYWSDEDVTSLLSNQWRYQILTLVNNDIIHRVRLPHRHNNFHLIVSKSQMSEPRHNLPFYIYVITNEPPVMWQWGNSPPIIIEGRLKFLSLLNP